MNAADFLLARRDSDRPAVFFQDQALSHRELAGRVDPLAAGLLDMGVGPGALVALVADNSIFWLVSYLAALRCGATVMPLSGKDSGRALAAALGMPDLTLVLCQTGYLKTIGELLQARPHVRLVAETELHGLAGKSPPAEWPQIDPARDAALRILTSGSTGDPKGVMISHRNLCANARSIISYLRLTADDRMMVVLPFHYCYGLSLLHTHLHVGGSVVLNNQFMFPTKVLDDLAAKRCTGFAGVPSTYQILLRKSPLRERPFPDLRLVQQAGGGLGVPLLRELREALPAQTQIFVMYGATEATARLSYLPPERLEEKIGSIGVPIPGVTLRVYDEAGNEVPPGEVGELVAEGENIALGYFGDHSNTGRLRDGRFYTGDMGWVDADGFFWLVSRKSEFIKSYGFRISPREIEDVIAALPQVAEVLVAGVKDEQAGEAVVAYVVPSPGAGLTPEDVRRHCTRHLPNHKIPQRVEFRTGLPKNEAGKLIRHQVHTAEQVPQP